MTCGVSWFERLSRLVRAVALSPLLSIAAVADDRPDYGPLLIEMQQRALALPGVVSAMIDKADASVKATTDTGATYTLAPDNLYRQLEALPADGDRAATIDYYFASLAQSLAPERPKLDSTALEHILPVVRIEHPFADVPGADAPPAEGKPDNRLAEATFLPGLSVLLVLDAGQTLTYLTRADLAKLGQPQDALAARAIANLAAKAVGTVKVTRLHDNPWIDRIEVDGTFDGSLLLLPEPWAGLARSAPRLVVAYPARAGLLVGDAADPRAVSILRRFAKEAVQKDDHPVTDRLMLWQDGKWSWLP